jgi:hypothetical protein
MLNPLINTRTLRMVIFAVMIGLLPIATIVPAGAKEKTLSQKELKNLIANAETKADHERVAQYFDAEAAKYEAEAKEHGELATFYQKANSATPGKYPGSIQSFQHCDSLSKSLLEAAANARQLAADHREMAKAAK